MSVDDPQLTTPVPGPAPLVIDPRRRSLRRIGFRRRRDRPPRPRVRKLRFFLILSSFGALAVISVLFGMLTAVASDLHGLENQVQFKESVDSYLYDDTGAPIGVLAPPNQQVIDRWPQISQAMVHAIVSVEDRRFWTDPGVDVKGVARALISDVTGGPREGASTIAEQFVKNAEAEQDHRTVFEKLREAMLAFQLVHKWKRTKILTEYLNTIYFGNGAYGIESAARVYFGQQLGYNPGDPSSGGCGDPTAQNASRVECAALLRPYQAALLAGMVANPTEFDPVLNPSASKGRRNLVLRDMYEQRYITRGQYEYGIHRPLPVAQDIQQPQEPAAAPYFTAWVRPQIVRALIHEGVPPKLAQYKAYYGGLKIHLTINLKMQQAAQQAVDDEFPAGSNGPTASLVAIDNKTGEVRAMVSGSNSYATNPFNLATLGYRQPGSSFKIFTLAEALMTGDYGPDSIIDSAPQDIPYNTRYGVEHFIVHNFGNTYSGPITLQEATDISDNTVFAQVGVHVGTRNIRHIAKLMGIRSPISTNDAMILGGLKTGVSALDMAHAYETVATGGLKVYNPTLGDIDDGPIGIHSITCIHGSSCGVQPIVNNPQYLRVLPADVAATIHEMLEGVVSPGGTAPNAAIPGVDVVGKTGTTSNYVDAWFVGWTPQITTAVWVGYPNSGVPMLTNYGGEPVEGGTYPALIWRDFTEQALQIIASEQPTASAGSSTTTTSTGEALTGAGSVPNTTVPAGATTPGSSAPTPPAGAATTPNGATTPTAAPTTPVAPPSTTTPAPTPVTPPSSTGGTTSGTGGAGIGGG